MKLKGSKKHLIILPIVFLIIYTFVAAVPLGSDMYFMPVWIQSIIPDTAKAALSGITSKQALTIQADADDFHKEPVEYFITNKRFGYFTENGNLLRSSPINDRISASSTAWSVYTEQSSKIPVYNPDGTLITTINRAGFVHIDEDRMYLFEKGGNAVCEYTADGKRLWRYIHAAPITAFNSSVQGTIIGFSDGKLVCVDRNGDVLFDFYTGGSSYRVVLGAALSEDGRYAACVCGLDQQRVLLIDLDLNKHKIVYHAYLKGNLRRQLFVNFDKKGENVIFECAEGIGFIDCTQFVSGIIPDSGFILNLGDESYKNIKTILTHNGQKADLYCIESPMHLIGKTSFNAQKPFLIQNQEKLFLATETHLVRIDIKGIAK